MQPADHLASEARCTPAAELICKRADYSANGVLPRAQPHDIGRQIIELERPTAVDEQQTIARPLEPQSGAGAGLGRQAETRGTSVGRLMLVSTALTGGADCCSTARERIFGK